MRLFIALELPDAAKEHLACVVEDLRGKLPRGAWVTAADMHITLAFLGETDPDMIPVIVEALEAATTRARPLELCIDRLGAFPNLTRASVLWAGVSEATDKTNKLSALARTVRTLLAGAEPPVDFDPKPFKAHITLARFKQRADCAIVERTSMQALSIKLDSLVLFETAWVHGGGHRYEQRAVFRLH